MKKIILIWDFDGAIGQINSSMPYNFNFQNFNNEIENVKEILEILDQYNIKCCFAITGFSAEEGVFPYTFPSLIKEINLRGHEVASHSWRHEWSSIFTKKQIDKSLKRSKLILEECIANNHVHGFVPPHNRPMTWLQKGAFSFGDRGIFPLFKMANTENLISLLKKNNYKWIRITHNNLFNKLLGIKRNITGKVYKHKGILVIENHYNGFDEKVTSHILNSKNEFFTVSAHPLMFSFENKKESKKNFLNFLDLLSKSNQKINFIRPSDLL